MRRCFEPCFNPLPTASGKIEILSSEPAKISDWKKTQYGYHIPSIPKWIDLTVVQIGLQEGVTADAAASAMMAKKSNFHDSFLVSITV